MDSPSPFMAVNEAHMFVFPNVDFNGMAKGANFSSPLLKLPSFGNWWIWGVQATRMLTSASGEMPTGTGISINIFDSGKGEFWWTGGALNSMNVFPLQNVAGKAANPGIFSEPLFVKGGSSLVPLVQQTSGSTPTGQSLLQIALIATLADSSQGNIPVVPSMAGALARTKGKHYKAIVDFTANAVAVGATLSQQVVLNKNSPFIMQAMTSNLAVTDNTHMNPLTIDDQVLVNVFDTRTTWKFASPSDINFNLLFGPFAARPYVPPSFHYMEADQNLNVQVTPVAIASGGSVTPAFVIDGYLEEEVSSVPTR